MTNRKRDFLRLPIFHFKLLVCGFLMLTSFAMFGQDHLLIKKGTKYFFAGQEYKCSELRPVYEANEEALILYNEGMGKKSLSQYLTVGGLASFLTGLVLYVNVSEENKAYGAWMIIAGLIMEPLALGFSISGSVKLIKARKVFNKELLEKRKYQSNLSLSLGSTKSGVGFILEF